MFPAASNSLGMALFEQLRHDNQENIVISPVSIGLAFAMTWAGARGPTATEMAGALHFEQSPDALANSAAKLLRTLSDPSRGTTLKVANRLFVERRYQILPEFLAFTRDRFQAPAESVDFASTPEAGRRLINGWISEQTEQRIKDLLPQGSIDTLTRLVLANAVYFLGNWRVQFNPERTTSQEFKLGGTQTRQVPMMRGTLTAKYAHPAGAQVLELAYAGSELSMVVVLPDAPDGLPALEAGLTKSVLDAWLGQLAQNTVFVALPRFEVRYKTALKQPLTRLGMKLAFSSAADFRGITAKPELYIDDAYHEAFIKVDEKGTEAAAATAVVMTRKKLEGPQHPLFVADHPFLYVIRDVTSGTLLFLGRITNPASG